MDCVLGNIDWVCGFVIVDIGFCYSSGGVGFGCGYRGCWVDGASFSWVLHELVWGAGGRRLWISYFSGHDRNRISYSWWWVIFARSLVEPTFFYLRRCVFDYIFSIKASVKAEQLSGVASFINMAKSAVTVRFCSVVLMAWRSWSAASVHPK